MPLPEGRRRRTKTSYSKSSKVGAYTASEEQVKSRVKGKVNIKGKVLFHAPPEGALFVRPARAGKTLLLLYSTQLLVCLARTAVGLGV